VSSRAYAAGINLATFVKAAPLIRFFKSLHVPSIR